MKKGMNTKGFSLVELIIVIAIMAVLVGVLAPQYLKYVKSSKVSTDISNGENIANAIAAAIADNGSGGSASVVGKSWAASAQIISDANGNPFYAPATKATTANWSADFDDVQGVKKVYIGSLEVWPSGETYRSTMMAAKGSSN